ncbi:transcription initiation factor TFIID subunit 4-like isoform X2 [Chiloscyllium plagiosum]|uniref:transcription initiation factor TFIID subunit 4-like isoform X2 n=1 Tax=Chiloscyllium plagiosum TaxID=36176 RepID=UPI001CB853BD|nr:transcription initiation factor TFIID subunit 4-like isoform X2 [Chiloscyllium plagiosum]
MPTPSVPRREAESGGGGLPVPASSTPSNSSNNDSDSSRAGSCPPPPPQNGPGPGPEPGPAGTPASSSPAASLPQPQPPVPAPSPAPTPLRVMPLPERQNQAGPFSGGGGGGGGEMPPSPALMKTAAVTTSTSAAAAATGSPLPASRAPTVTVQRISVSSPHIKTSSPLNQVTVPLLQNLQVPAGMVLVRSDSGQLVLVPQKVIAQAQAKARAQGAGNLSSAVSTGTPSVRISTIQATGTQRIPNQVKTSTQQMNQFQAGGQTNAAPQRITVVQAAGGAIMPKTVSTIVQKQTSAPADRSVTVPVVQTTASPETLENVKKCKNFLATLIKLASSGSQSPQMSSNVKALVQKLLDGKMEVEEFTEQLYKELKSSPQPYLVPFLKRSLPDLRKLMPNSQAFIQQCLQKPATPAAPIAASSGGSKQVSPGQASKSITVMSASQPTKVLQTLPSPQMVVQQSGVVIKSQASPLPKTQTVTLQKPPNHIIVPVSQNQAKETKAGAATLVTKVTLSQVNKNPTNVLIRASPGQILKKEAGGTTFREEDDINDVASMAGVNVNEERARILATNSELVGTIIRSCKDEAFLSSASLQRKALEIGKTHGVTEVNSDVLSTISHATQEHLRELVEKLTVIAQHRMMTYKDNDRYSLLNDTRSQLKFFEQLDRLEKQRKDEDEREALLRLAKSRTKHEDPEQLRLKQKAKEMQQLELAQLQQREANLAALAAIGPRKRKMPDSPGLRTGNEGLGGNGNAPGGLRATPARPYLRQRVTRVNLRDLILCLEQDQARKHSLLLYRAYLK